MWYSRITTQQLAVGFIFNFRIYNTHCMAIQVILPGSQRPFPTTPLCTFPSSSFFLTSFLHLILSRVSELFTKYRCSPHSREVCVYAWRKFSLAAHSSALSPSRSPFLRGLFQSAFDLVIRRRSILNCLDYHLFIDPHSLHHPDPSEALIFDRPTRSSHSPFTHRPVGSLNTPHVIQLETAT